MTAHSSTSITPTTTGRAVAVRRAPIPPSVTSGTRTQSHRTGVRRTPLPCATATSPPATTSSHRVRAPCRTRLPSAPPTRRAAGSPSPTTTSARRQLRCCRKCTSKTSSAPSASRPTSARSRVISGWTLAPLRPSTLRLSPYARASHTHSLQTHQVSASTRMTCSRTSCTI